MWPSSLVCATNAGERRPLATKMGDAFQIEPLRSCVEAGTATVEKNGRSFANNVYDWESLETLYELSNCL